MKKIIVALCCVFALSLALVGCGGSGGSNGADAKAAWTGTWDLYEMDDNGTTTSSSDIEQLRALGLDVYLELGSDGKAALVLFGESMEGTWEAKSTTAATYTMEGQTVDMKLENEKLSMEQNGSKLIFTKGEARSSSSASSSASS